MSADPISTFLQALNDADPKQSGDYWQLHCPAHEDKQHSLSLARGNDGRALLKCFAGCDVSEVVRKVGLNMADLFASAEERKPLKRSWQIKSDTGQLVAIHHRTDRFNGKKEISWERNGTNSLDGLATRELPLYGMEKTPELDGETVIIVEGEKAADALLAVGVPAMGTVCGASSAPDIKVLKRIAHLEIVLWPDNDEAGRAHMVKIAESLAHLGRPPRMIEWGDAPDKGDAFDFVADNRGAQDVQRLIGQSKRWVPSEQPKISGQLLPKCDVTLLPTGEYKVDFDAERISYVVKSLNRSTRNFAGFVTVMWWPVFREESQTLVYNHHVDFRSGSSKSQLTTALNRFQQQYEPAEGWHVFHEATHQALDRAFKTGGAPQWEHEIDWQDEEEQFLVEPYLFAGQHTEFIAVPSSGKSLFSLAMALSIATGHPFIPGIRVNHTGPVLYCDYEDSHKTFMQRIRLLCSAAGVPIPKGRMRYRRMWGLLADAAEELREDISENEIVAVVVDSGGKAVVGEIKDEAVVMRYFDACRSFGENVTVMTITHLPKDQERQDMPIGSQYWTSEPRSIWKLTRDQQEARSDIAIAIKDVKENHTQRRGLQTYKVTFTDDAIAFSPADPSQYEATETQMDLPHRLIVTLLREPFKDGRELAEVTGKSQSQTLHALKNNRDVFEPTNERPARWSVISHVNGAPNPAILRRGIYVEDSSGQMMAFDSDNSVNSHSQSGDIVKGETLKGLSPPTDNTHSPASTNGSNKRYRDPVTGETVEYL